MSRVHQVLVVASLALTLPDFGILEANGVAAQESADEKPILSGRITDETGAPVSDARLDLSHVETGIGNRSVYSAGDGSYAVQNVSRIGEHRVMISSDRCLGFQNYSQAPRVMLDPKKPTVRDFVLKLACRVRVQALDEDGHPVPNVQFFLPGPHTSRYYKTDRDGWATLGGFAPSPADRKFAAHSDDFAIAPLHVRLDDPKTIVERKVVMKRGVDVKGRALCSDGKPASGWKILALPEWWDFSSYPHGQPIATDGSFVLKHITPGAHDVTVSIPIGRTSSTTRDALRGVDLSAQTKPLEVRIDYPSPASMAYITGQISYRGGTPKQGLRIQAEDKKRIFSTDYLMPREKTFRLGPLPPGGYRLQFSSSEIESKSLDSINAPTTGLQVEINIRGAYRAAGVVFAGQGADAKPAKDFRIRILRTPSYSQWGVWQRITNSEGRFTEELPEAGTYAIEATADGFATVRSQPFRTDHVLNNVLRIELPVGIPLSGTVADEDGHPISGAMVVSLGRAGGQAAVSAVHLAEAVGIKTVEGKFQFAGLTPGDDTLHILHPDYATVILPVSIKAGRPPLKIIMIRGGTVYGYVHDSLGRLASGVQLRFKSTTYRSYRHQNEFAAAITDENGYYEVRHLPEQLVFVVRDDESSALGVVRQAILPANGQKRKLDFGSSMNVVDHVQASKVSGRLLLNGKPVADRKLLLAGESPHSASLGAYTKTDSDGSFVFLGIPFGEHFLYCAEDEPRPQWWRIRALRINSTARNFGRIEHNTGTFTVHLKGRSEAVGHPTRAFLHKQEPGQPNGRDAGIFARPHEKDGLFIFEQVPVGKYIVGGVFGEKPSAENRPPVDMGEERQVRKAVETTATKASEDVSIELPPGTAVFRGTIEPSLREPGMPCWLTLRTNQDAYIARVRIREDRTFEATDLPEAEYQVTLMRSMPSRTLSDTLGKVVLKAGESITFPVTKGTIEPSTKNDGALFVSVVTSEGIPLPGCEIHLTGPGGSLSPKWINPDGRVMFQGSPGKYELAVSFSEFKPAMQSVEIKPLDAAGRLGRDVDCRITLAPLD